MELLTPSGVAGIAVVRVDAAERSAVLAASSISGSGGGVAPRAKLQLEGVDIDDVLLIDRGEHGLELHVHGAPAVLAALHRHFGLAAVPPRNPAERLLREALAEEQIDLALEQLGGDFDAELATIAALPPAARASAVAAARARSRHALAQVHAPRVVLVGRQNAGKSSLFNRLLARERVNTGPTPGLTRDPVAEVTTLDGYPYELVDTAGEGATPSALDAAALQAGRSLRSGAIVALVVDATRPWHDLDDSLAAQSHLVIANKCDLEASPWPSTQRCHARIAATRDPLPHLRATFGRLLRTHRGLPPAGAVGGFAALDAAQSARLDSLE